MVTGQQTFDNGTTYYLYSLSPASDTVIIQVPVPNLIGYAGGPICFQGSTCGSIPYVQFAGKPLNLFTGGLLSPVPDLSPVPENSTLFMLVLGLTLLLLTANWSKLQRNQLLSRFNRSAA